MKISKSVAGFYETDKNVRQVYDFNQGWLFLKGDLSGASQINCNEESFDTVHLPHGIDAYEKNLSGMRNYQGRVWYRKHFCIDSDIINENLTLYFEGIMGKCTVYIDGEEAAKHYGGYLPFHLDLTEFGIETGDHVVAICADNSDDKSFPPGRPQDSLDFTYLGGIYRNVYLIRRKNVHVTLPTEAQTCGGVTIGTLSLNDNKACISTSVEIINKSKNQKSVEAIITVKSYNDVSLATKIINGTILVNGRMIISDSFELKEPKLWHPEHPELYWLDIEIKNKSQVLDRLKVRFGIRTLALNSEEGLILNGKVYEGKLNGVNRHQDYAMVGNALPDSGQYRDALLLRKAGANVIRAAHYPLAPAFMDACDELGMFVSVANPGWQYYNLLNGRFAERVLNDTVQMARRDKNRPSVLFWEIVLNETLVHPIKTVKKQHRIIHDEIPFGSTITAGDMTIGRKAGLDLLFTGIKETKGWCTFCREYGDGLEVDGWISQNAPTRVERFWGEKPMLDQMLNRMKYLKELVDSDVGRIGGTLWCGIDHQRGYHPDPFIGGLLDSFRIPRYTYYLYRCQYANEPEIHIIHELTQISDKDVVILSNCEQVRIKFMGLERILDVQVYQGKGGSIYQPLIFKDIFDFDVIAAYYRSKTHKLKMVAEGIIGGKVVCRTEKRYAERTSALKAFVDDLAVPLVADGSDFVPVRIEVVDNKGVIKVLASERIQIEVSGEGQLISDTKACRNFIQTEFGTATALIRSTLVPGRIKVIAFAKGLKPAKIEFTSIPSNTEMLFNDNFTDRFINNFLIKESHPITVVDEDDKTDREKLMEENRLLRLRLTEKEQDIMELMSHLPIEDEE